MMTLLWKYTAIDTLYLMQGFIAIDRLSIPSVCNLFVWAVDQELHPFSEQGIENYGELVHSFFDYSN